LVTSGGLYRLVIRASDDPVVIASSIAALILTGHVSTAPSDDVRVGFDRLNAVYMSPDDYSAVVEEFVRIVCDYRSGALLRLVIDQRGALGKLPARVLAHPAVRQHIGRLFTVEDFFQYSQAIREVVPDAIIDLAKAAWDTPSFVESFADRPVKFEDAATHHLFVEAGALDRVPYRQKLFGMLREVPEDLWASQIITPDAGYRLLTAAIVGGFNKLNRVADGLEQVGMKIVTGGVDGIAWDQAPEDWGTIYRALDAQRRRTAASKVTDRLKEDSLTRFPRLVGLFGNDMGWAFAESKEDSLVREIAMPIVKSDDRTLLEWLALAWQDVRISWTSATDPDRETFKQTLQDRIIDAPPDSAKLLQRIGSLVGVPLERRKDGPEGDGSA
jgi:hypothetical protein